ncbi:TnsA endonuclease C-terminal domain-containing protein [Salmonella enterica]|nr:TnsA endonuclease C-terminal domain-containing protein [Salmonella enterica]EJB9134475.1 TnsA endonuclease C-terminal domain-containing protein [Salmonella enterica]EJC0501167.1 TnsA endonuclease C-terminal domain-containing protein [Salmonella enterica]EJC0931558.1 TnsA endonuclease C-terminal domain-containing protein [Salmonella enterica]EJC0941265.1 TnsA endonuclease C-terminal domain-containing protein [Salmonella enterica]
MFEGILQRLEASLEEKLPIVLSELDQIQGLERGTNLKYFRHLAAQNAFQWDM